MFRKAWYLAKMKDPTVPAHHESIESNNHPPS
jgi:hypothetical protein